MIDGSRGTVRQFRQDRSVTQHRLATGTLRRIAAYARPYRRQLSLFLALILVDAALSASVPLILKHLIDDGILGDRPTLVTALALTVAGIAVVQAGLSLVQRWCSAPIGEGLVFDLRTQVFEHVQRMPLAFFSRTQTGALVSRLNTDVQGAQQAFTSTLSTVVSNIATVV